MIACDKLVAMARSVVPGNYPAKPGEQIGPDGGAEVNEKAARLVDARLAGPYREGDVPTEGKYPWSRRLVKARRLLVLFGQ
jgi:hypothetical protein